MLLAQLAAVPVGFAVDTTKPCDIFAAGKTPCVAAHSTVRAMYGSYAGPLYQVHRKSDGGMKDVHVTLPCSTLPISFYLLSFR